MEINEKNSALFNEAEQAKPAKRVYHTPELTMHGELTSLTSGVGSSGLDGGFYTSFTG